MSLEQMELGARGLRVVARGWTLPRDAFPALSRRSFRSNHKRNCKIGSRDPSEDSPPPLSAAFDT